jgi:hypothetical protein
MTSYKKLDTQEKLDDNDIPKIETPEEKSMTLSDFMIVAKPYFWPSAGSDGAFVNRIRSSATWLMVIFSKTSNIIAPIFLSMATNDLIDFNFHAAVIHIIVYCYLRFLSSFFRGMVYQWSFLLYYDVVLQYTLNLIIQKCSLLYT